MEPKEKEVFYTADFEWPKQLNTSLRDEKIIDRLERELERNPNDPNSRQALENAKRLRDLIPRANALRWYILLFRDSCVYLGWFTDFCHIWPIPSYARASSIVGHIEYLIVSTEKEGGMPNEVNANVLPTFYAHLKTYFRKWGEEGVRYFHETTESYYHL